jgi:hypothetical protein
MHKKSKEKKSKRCKFPLWLLFVLLGFIFALGLFFNLKLKQTKQIQNFGFRFY